MLSGPDGADVSPDWSDSLVGYFGYFCDALPPGFVLLSARLPGMGFQVSVCCYNPSALDKSGVLSRMDRGLVELDGMIAGGLGGESGSLLFSLPDGSQVLASTMAKIGMTRVLLQGLIASLPVALLSLGFGFLLGLDQVLGLGVSVLAGAAWSAFRIFEWRMGVNRVASGMLAHFLNFSLGWAGPESCFTLSVSRDDAPSIVIRVIRPDEEDE